ncbi:MAG: hypothetical protein ACM3KR_09065 [Deltaproteobacteria bacterium]
MRLEELLVSQGTLCATCVAVRVENLADIEDIQVLESFMLPNNCVNEGCYIKALKAGEEIFLLCTTECGFSYEDFFIITRKQYEASKEFYKVRNAKGKETA